jgi:hypothetical protein
MATQFSGGTYVSTTFSTSFKSDIQANLIAQLINAGWTNVPQATGQGPGNVGAVTLTIAAPCVVTWSAGAHGFLGGEKVILQVSSGGALPGGLSVNTVYYVKYVNTTTFNLATSLGGGNITTTGSQSGTITLNTQSVLLQSATQTNVTYPIRVLLQDNLGNCIQISLQNQSGSLVGTNSTASNIGCASLQPGTTSVPITLRVIATQYHFLCFVPLANQARGFVMAGMYYVPAFLTGIASVGYCISNTHPGDTQTSMSSPCFRTSYQLMQNTGNGEGAQTIWNTALLDFSNGNNPGPGVPQVLVLPSSFLQSQNGGARWANADLNTADVLLYTGLTAFYTDEGTIKGQFFDMIFMTTSFPVDTTDTFNGHNWWNLTGSNVSGGIWVATS